MLDWNHIYATRSARMGASEIRELLKLLEQPDIISFAGGIPDPEFFPADVFSKAYSDVLQGPESASALQYGVSEGYLPLRQWIVGQMAQLGIPCAVENILITSGSQQALDYLGKLFLSPGDTALVGWPTYLGALQAFNAYEPRYDKLQPYGNRSAADYTQAAESAGGRVKFAYASVDFANPTGETLDLAARNRILDLAESLDITVIEDAAYQSLRYDGVSIPPVLALDIERQDGDINKCRTLYCGSFSKTLSPGLRLGWVCAAAPLISKLVLIKQASDLNTSVMNQMVMAKVAEEVFETQVATIQESYRLRRDTMLAALEANMPDGVSWTRPDGGMFIWLTLPEEWIAADLLKQAIEEIGVAFVPGHAFFPDQSGKNTLRLSFSNSKPETIREGVARLAGFLRAHSG